jgi:hypothetical protein
MKLTSFIPAGVALSLLVGVPVGAAATTNVGTAGQFAAAVDQMKDSGGTIVLAPSWEGDLVVGARGPHPLEVLASAGARVERLVLVNTQAVTVSGLRVRPRGRHAQVYVAGSRNIRLLGLSVAGTSALHANASIVRSTDVRIVDSTFTRCGEGTTPVAGFCVRLNTTRGVSIVSSRFHDCFGCDFVQGRYNAHLTIRQSRFERAVVGECTLDPVDCHHQDLVHLVDGRDLLIDANHFGLQQWPGAAQIYLNGSMRRVTVTNNVFVGTDPRVPGVVTRTALWLGNRRADDVPRRVLVAHNTILSGQSRVIAGENWPTATSVFVSPLYAGIPVGDRPVLANNVLGLLGTPNRVCPFLQAAVRNVIVSGSGCSASDVVALPALDPLARPTATSTPLIDRGSRRFATSHDALGVRRDATPDIGAYEFRAG